VRDREVLIRLPSNPHPTMRASGTVTSLAAATAAAGFAIVSVLGAQSAPQPPAGPADRAAPRTDANSMAAHRELVAKAKGGRIDVYFVGDSIVRRWGALDYPELLANWRQNFGGWHAGNFGWGADRTQHILWRLENGELDGVHPKAIVVLAGTNNVGNAPGGDAKIADVTRGVTAIVELCRRKAPGATILLTGIFPRNDNMAVVPEIRRINANLAKLADGKAIRFLDIGDRLAGPDGTLVEGMTGDRLHPTLKGYQVWADALRPRLAELLGPPAAIDRAPPPTGDPSARARAQAGFTPTPVKGRLMVAPDKRHLQYDDGRPFFYMADTAWMLLHRLTRDEATRYLEDRARKGFSVIQTVALAELDGLVTASASGELPLIDRDPARPNPAYFAHVDAVIEKAAALGLHVGLLPTWGHYWKAGERRLFTPDNARTYGRFLGARYKDRAIIWVLGGDQNVATPDERAIVDAMAEGLKAGDGGRNLITFHPRGPGQSSVQVHDAPWLDFHMAQTSHGGRDHDTGLFIERDLAMTPLRPTLDGEPRYETMPVGFYFRDHSRLDRFDDDDVRQAAWWAVMAGAAGHAYGHNSVWQMYAPGREPVLFANVPWPAALDHPGATQMGYLRRFMESHAFQTLVPDQKLIADGPRSGPAKVRALRATDGSRALVYSPRGEPFTVDKAAITAAPRVRESWFDPRYGARYEMHTTDNLAFQTYTPPTSGRGQDWVLILEAVP
jgi:lysophospholipase L1-like esterase